MGGVMGPVSAFAFSVCGWVRFEGGGWAGVAGVATGWGTQGAVLGVVALGAAVHHSWTAMAMAPGRERWTQGRGPGRAPRVGDQEISNFSRGGYLIHKN